MAIDYTTVPNVKQLGDMSATVTTDDAIIGAIITAMSRTVDQYTTQQWSAQTLTNKVYSVLVNRDGNAVIYTDVPIINTVTAIDYRIPSSSTAWVVGGIDVVNNIAIDNSNIGSKIRVFTPNFGTSRAYPGYLEMRVTGTTGYSASTALPSDFEYGMRMLVWWAYKQRLAPYGNLSITDFGTVPVPQQWPSYIRSIFDRYKKVVPL